MIQSIKIAFNADRIAINLMKAFAIRNDTDRTIIVQMVLRDDLQLNITVLSKDPSMYFSLYSTMTHQIVDTEISNIDLKDALDILELRFQHTLTKNPPTVNKELSSIWLEYLKTNPNFHEFKV